MSERKLIIRGGSPFYCDGGHFYAAARRDIFTGGACVSADFEFGRDQPDRVEMRCHCGANVSALFRLALCPEDRERFDEVRASGGFAPCLIKPT
jgi:hypothetical protein